MHTRILFTAFTTLLLFSCRPGSKEKKINLGRLSGIYAEYKLEVTEGNDNIVIRAQLKDGSEFGDALSVSAPASFTLDGDHFSADTAKFGGYFYEIFKPLSGFSGNHKITYTNENGDEYSEDFLFTPFALISELPDTVSLGDIKLDLSGLGEKEIVRVVLVDTSFFSEETNLADTVLNGKLLIEAAELGKLSGGPIQMELIREAENNLSGTNGLSGKLTVYQSLRREFVLKRD